MQHLPHSTQSPPRDPRAVSPRRSGGMLTATLVILALGCADSAISDAGRTRVDSSTVADASRRPDGSTPDGSTPDGSTPDGSTPDGSTPDGSTSDGSTPDGSTPPAVIRGRFESAAPLLTCGAIARWNAPDGVLLRPTFDLCGGDMALLADTIVDNLDRVAERGQRAMLIIGQGPFLPDSWLSACETFYLNDPRFAGDVCLPWDASYQANLRSALADHIGPAVAGHPALAGVYFTISTMTNGSEMHFRVDRSSFPYPGDDVFLRAYLDVMDIFQNAFGVPIVLEAGHCIWRGSAIDCATPLALYRHARDTYGPSNTGIALWNCAERFWVESTPEADGTRAIIEEAERDRVSIGCQSVGPFTGGACRFTHDAVADYGTLLPGSFTDCDPTVPLDQEGACVDTMRWFAGVSRRAPTGVVLHGTWSELWSQDHAPSGIGSTSTACRDAINLLAP